MKGYFLRRLLLLPFTLFLILLVNFAIINMAPGDPTTQTQVDATGGATRQKGGTEIFGDERYLQFREHYGLTLPIFFNDWPWLSQQTIKEEVKWIAYPPSTVSFKKVQERRTKLGDQAKYILPKLQSIMNDPGASKEERELAARMIVRGSIRQAHLGQNLTEKEREENRQINEDNIFLMKHLPLPEDKEEILEKKLFNLSQYVDKHPLPHYSIKFFFFETRFFRYFKRVMTLDFGTLRNDQNKTVISEVTKRFKYSLTISITPLLITFFLCQIIGMMMAVFHHRLVDHGLNLVCLILYATPIFVVAPFLIEKIALNHHFPFTHYPIPISGFTSPDQQYATLSSWERLIDIAAHIFLPILAILYGSLAAESRLSRTAILEVMRHDYVRTAYAKGLSPFKILTKHVGRNAGITIVTSLAGSLGVVLGGSLIVETLFDINGFGKFFYEAVINRDYNVILFSAIAGSFLTLVGYVLADLAYTLLDPRIHYD